MTFSAAQTAQLLQPINPSRVLKDGKNNSHVSQQDVTAHLTRIFGFGNFSTELLHQELLFEVCRNPDAEYRQQRWDVAYRATMRVTIFKDFKEGEFVPNRHEDAICSYEDSSVGDAQNQVRHDAHDLALKSAISLAKKRCCINLGDQFGLSLYNKGQMTALVKGTLVMPETPDTGEGEKSPDIQEGIEQQVSLGTDEDVHDDHLRSEGEREPTEEQKERLAHSVGASSESEPKTETQPEGEGLVRKAIDRAQARDLERRRREMFALFSEAKFTAPGSDDESKEAARKERLGYCAAVLDREVESSSQLTYEDLEKVNAALRALIESEKTGAKA